MTKWIDNIDSPVVWAVMVEKDGQLQMCRAGSHPMIYVSGAMARAQMRRLKSEVWVRLDGQQRISAIDGLYRIATT